MSRIDDIFARLRAEERSALMPFITAGYPSLEATKRTLPALEEAGASIVEVGIPFSDPIADGPVIAASMHEALVAGVTPRQILDLVAELRSSLSMGLVAMLSVSIINRMGADAFIDEAAEAGFDGLIVPDVDTTGGSSSPAAALSERCAARDLSFSLLLAPTTGRERIGELTALCRGFVYILSRVGLTGEQQAAPVIEARVAEVREFTDLPLTVGFGISTPEHVAAVTSSADAAIVGSALVKKMGGSDDPPAAAGAFVAELAGAL